MELRLLPRREPSSSGPNEAVQIVYDLLPLIQGFAASYVHVVGLSLSSAVVQSLRVGRATASIKSTNHAQYHIVARIIIRSEEVVRRPVIPNSSRLQNKAHRCCILLHTLNSVITTLLMAQIHALLTEFL